MDVAELAYNSAKKKRFREQLRAYKKMWKRRTTADEAISKGCWKPSMGRPDHPLSVFSYEYDNSDSYETLNDTDKQEKRLAGCYSLLAFIHDNEPNLKGYRINNNIIVSPEIIEQTLAASRNQIGAECSDKKIAEIYMIRECYNRVKVDLIEHCERGAGIPNAEDLAEKKKIQNAKTLSNVELFDETARRFEDRSIIPLRKDETRYDLDRSLKPWFDLAIQRLLQVGKTNEIRLLQYEYKNLLHYAKGLDIKIHRGRLFDLAGKQADELAKKFGDIAKSCKEDEIYKKTTETESQDIHGQINGRKAGDTKQTTPETTKLKVEPLRDQVFICYSHKDKRWLDDLQTHLKPHVRNGSITAWSDKQIVPGSKWFSEIKVALASTKVAVLLVTPNFLASDFIHEHELTPLLKEAEKGDVRIIWIPVRACSYKETALKDYQVAIDPDKPLANMKAERDKAWVGICEEIKRAAAS